MKASQVIQILEKTYPLYMQEQWDHCGLQCGDVNQEITHIMVGLDADIFTLKQAIDQNCQMLITHHPFLFNNLTLDLSTPVGQFIELAIKNNIVIYSLHTSLDKVSMNHWLIECFDVKNIDDVEESCILRKAELNTPLDMNAFLSKVKEVFNLQTIKYAGHKDMISKIAICGGSGADFIDCVSGQADAYITGDTKYHQGLDALNNDLLLVDVGHHVEVIMIKKLKEFLESKIDLDILEAESKDYYQYF